MSSVTTHADGAVLTVTIDRPDRLNALDEPCRRALLEALQGAHRDPEVAAVVLTGAGRAFCTGQDVSAESELVDAGATVAQTYNPLVIAIRSTPTPVIAAINGPAVGAGLGLALACDLRYMAESAYLSCVFSQVALVPDSGVSRALVARLGHAVAFEAAATGRRIGAEEAAASGLVNEVVSDDDVLARARERAAQLAAGPRLALGETKRLFVAAARAHELELLELEADAQGRAARTEDHRAAVEAFRARLKR